MGKSQPKPDEGFPGMGKSQLKPDEGFPGMGKPQLKPDEGFPGMGQCQVETGEIFRSLWLLYTVPAEENPAIGAGRLTTNGLKANFKAETLQTSFSCL